MTQQLRPNYDLPRRRQSAVTLVELSISMVVLTAIMYAATYVQSEANKHMLGRSSLAIMEEISSQADEVYWLDCRILEEELTRAGGGKVVVWSQNPLYPLNTRVILDLSGSKTDPNPLTMTHYDIYYERVPAGSASGIGVTRRVVQMAMPSHVVSESDAYADYVAYLGVANLTIKTDTEINRVVATLSRPQINPIASDTSLQGFEAAARRVAQSDAAQVATTTTSIAPVVFDPCHAVGVVP